MVRALILLSILGLTSLGFARPALPGDIVRITSSDSHFLLDRRVDSRGMISLPGLGDLAVLGHEAPAIEGRIAKALQIANRAVPENLEVRLVADRNTPISIVGAVIADGSHRSYPGMTVEDALKLATAREDADLSKVQRFPIAGKVNIAKLSDQVSPGDRLVVSVRAQSPEVFVLGGVVRPGAVEWKAGLTVRQALEAVGGLTEQANGEQVELRSPGKSQKISLSTSLDRVLVVGETLYVGTRETQFVTVGGGVRQPGLIPFEFELSLLEALDYAGGLLRGQRATVILTKKSGAKLKMELDDVRRGKKPDLILEPFDRIDFELFVHPASGDSKGGL